MGNTKVSFKVDMKNVKVAGLDLQNVNAVISGDIKSVSEADAKILVDGGFADYIDERGYVVYEDRAAPVAADVDADAEVDEDEDAEEVADAPKAKRPTARTPPKPSTKPKKR